MLHFLLKLQTSCTNFARKAPAAHRTLEGKILYYCKFSLSERSVTRESDRIFSTYTREEICNFTVVCIYDP